jgi:HK97 family phage major capsid protein
MKQIIVAMMAAHFAAFQSKAGGIPCYEKRDTPEIKSIADAIEKIGNAFDEYKKTNDARIEAIKNGKSTADFDAKLAKMDEHINSISEMKSKLEKVETKLSRPGAFGNAKDDGETPEAAEYRHAFLDWMRAPSDNERQQKAASAAKALEAKSRAEGRETRAAQVITSTGSAGGFALPEQIESQIARLTVDISPIRQLATVRTVGTSDYKELIDVAGGAFEWLGEGDTRNQPQATEESLDDLFFNVEQWLIDSVFEAIAAGEGAAFVSGNGTKKPTGFLAGPTPVATTDASRAFGTLQYIASGQAAAMPTTPDIFYDIVYSLRARYRANAKWVTSKLVLAAMRKYKEATTNAYMWQPGLAAGQPDMFAGYPVVEAEDMPAVGAGTFPLAFGDFKEGYLIADRVGMRITRDEITAPGFVKFYVRKRVGGKLRNTQAIKLLKIAAS